MKELVDIRLYTSSDGFRVTLDFDPPGTQNVVNPAHLDIPKGASLPEVVATLRTYATFLECNFDKAL